MSTFEQNISDIGRVIDAQRAEIGRLREAAERVCWFDWSGNDADAVQSIDDLRKLLSSGERSDG